MFYELIYISKAVEGVTKDEINKIIEASRRSNREKGITGMLVCRKGEFIQILEGEKWDIIKLYEKISKDPRHKDVFLIYRGEIEKKEFTDWDMSYVDLDIPEKYAHLAEEYMPIIENTKRNMEERFKDSSMAKQMFVQLAYKERGLANN